MIVCADAAPKKNNPLCLDLRPRRKPVRRSARELVAHHLTRLEAALLKPAALAPATTEAYAILAACVAVVAVRPRHPSRQRTKAVVAAVGGFGPRRAYPEEGGAPHAALLAEVSRLSHPANIDRHPLPHELQAFPPCGCGFDAEFVDDLVHDLGSPDLLARTYASALEAYLLVAAVDLRGFALLAALPTLRHVLYQSALHALIAAPAVTAALLAGHLTALEAATIAGDLGEAVEAVHRLEAVLGPAAGGMAGVDVAIDFNVFAPPIAALAALAPTIAVSPIGPWNVEGPADHLRQLTAARAAMLADPVHDPETLRLIEGRAEALGAKLAGVRAINAGLRRQGFRKVDAPSAVAPEH